RGEEDLRVGARGGPRPGLSGRRRPLRRLRVLPAVRDERRCVMTFTLINASAGSGKTYTLTRKLAERIEAGLDPAQIIATTFTVKAAEELTGRIRSTLLDRAQVTEARGIDSAVIGTVNSVAGRLVTDYALDAGI